MRRWQQQSNIRPKFMTGRYGLDAYGRFLSVAGCVFIILSFVLEKRGIRKISSPLFCLCLALIVYTYSRFFSRNIEKRCAENCRYLERTSKIRRWLFLRWDRIRQSRDYAFFRCPGCQTTVRVPRRKGRIRITCRRCGYTFEKKT